MLKTIRATMYIGGILLLLGTAGSSDLNVISFGQIIFRCIISLAMLSIGYILEEIV